MKRIRPRPDFAVPDAVDRLLGRFEYPDLDTKPLVPRIGGGGPPLIFAAGNSSALAKASAHFQCQGINDQTKIMEGLQFLTDPGAECVFLDGEYFIDGDILVPQLEHVRFAGKGAKFTFRNAASITLGNASGVRFSFDGFEVTRIGTGSNVPIIGGQGAAHITVSRNDFHDIEGGPLVDWGGLTPSNVKLMAWGNYIRNINMRMTGSGFTSNGIFGTDENPGRGMTGAVFGNKIENITKVEPGLGHDYTLYIIDSGNIDGEGFIAWGNVLNNIPGVAAIAPNAEQIYAAHNIVDGVMQSGGHADFQTSLINTIQNSFNNQATFHQAGNLTTGTGVFKLPFSQSGTILGVRLAVGTSPTGGDLIVDVNKNGTTIFTTQANRPKVLDGDADGVGSFTTPNVTSLVSGDYLTVDIDQIGLTNPGANLTVVVQWRPS